jgi:NitT/TauT family transport system substrate-binding protein
MRLPPLSVSLLLPVLVLLAGCAKSAVPASAGAPVLTKIRLQTDWLAETEHGGFYQAVAKGYYREAGLDVEILPGGPGPQVPQKIIGGVADVGIYTSDAVIVNVSNNLPFLIIGVYMQHDPQAILLHEENPVNTFADLNGKTIMAVPGSNWLDYLKAHNGIDFKLIPLNYSLAQFMADKGFIEQCFITNEPFYARKNGAKPKTLLISNSGYDPYRTLFTTQKFAREHPDALRAFVAATVRGWRDFMTGDPAPANALIAQANDQMKPDFLEFSLGAMKENFLVTGRPGTGRGHRGHDPPPAADPGRPAGPVEDYPGTPCAGEVCHL